MATYFRTYPASSSTVGLATEATLLSVDGHVAAIETNTDAMVLSLASLDVKVPALGQATMANSTPVVIASNQSAVPVSAASLPLPAGAAMEATLSAMSAKLPAALGQLAMAASLSVVIASNQSTVPVSVASLPLPTGAATEATLAAILVDTGSIDGKLPATLGQKPSATSLAVVLASDQSVIPVSQSGAWSVSVSSSALPTGAATEATLSALNAKFSALGQNTAANSTPVVLASNQSAIPVTQSGVWSTGRTWTLSSGTDSVASAQSGTWTVGVSNLPTTADVNYGTPGASTLRVASMLGVGSTAVSNSNPVPISDAGGSITVDGTVSASNFPATADTNLGTPGASTIRTAAMLGVGSSAVSATNPVPTVAGGKTAITFTRNDYTGTPVTTGAYVQLIASTSAAITEIEIFDSSGETLKIAFGAAASEVDQVYVFPGGNGRIPLAIPAGTRVSIRAVSANASVGENTINYYG